MTPRPQKINLNFVLLVSGHRPHLRLTNGPKVGAFLERSSVEMGAMDVAASILQCVRKQGDKAVELLKEDENQESK